MMQKTCQFLKIIQRAWLTAYCCLVALTSTMLNCHNAAYAADKKSHRTFYTDELGVPFATWRVISAENLLAKLSSSEGRKLSADSRAYWRAAYLKRIGRVEEAAAEFDKCSNVDNFSPYSLAEMANVYLQAGDIEKAHKLINFAIEHGAANGADYEVRAQIEGLRGNLCQEAADYVKAAKLCSQTGDTKCTRYLALAANSLKRARKPQEALQLLSNLKDYALDKNNPSIALERGNCFFVLKRYKEAVAQYTNGILTAQNFIKTNPTDSRVAAQQIALVNAYRERSMAYEAMGNKIEAARDQAIFKTMSASVASDIIGK